MIATKYYEGKKQGDETADASFGGCGGGLGREVGKRRRREKQGRTSFLQRERQVQPLPHHAGHHYTHDSLPSSVALWGAVTVPPFFRGGHCSPRELQRRGWVTEARSVFAVFGFSHMEMYLRVKGTLARSCVTPAGIPHLPPRHLRGRGFSHLQVPACRLGCLLNCRVRFVTSLGRARSSVTAH